ncbi:hypothetical protein UB32_16825 [Mesobacillus subterraneus]|uniref:Uncharacterized protein n=2 Tax=Mesobacillus TaxID=2675231 RepID=A0A0D6Z773_9BACI|nr:hypothetical protein UB32_16825 [Mesobacillus subterraneus]MDQ0414278.1 hypothetical protein [Mesobacillus stamsii]
MRLLGACFSIMWKFIQKIGVIAAAFFQYLVTKVTYQSYLLPVFLVLKIQFTYLANQLPNFSNSPNQCTNF